MRDTQRRHRAPITAAVSAVAALTTLSLTAASGAATPSGEAVGISSNAASSKAHTRVLTADASWLVYARHGKAYARPTRGGKRVAIPDASSDNPPSLAGSFLVYPTRNLQRTRYLDLDTGATGPAKARWSSSSPDGGVFGKVAKKGGKVHGYDQSAAGGTVTDLGALPGMHKGSYVNALADEKGVVFLQQQADGSERVDYVAFAKPGHAVALRTDGLGFTACTSLTSNALGCAQYAGDKILRVPLDGGAPQKITVKYPKPRAHVEVQATAFVTRSHTFWAFAFEPDDDYRGGKLSAPLHSVPASSPHAKPAASSFRLAGPDQVVAGSTVVYVARSGRPSKAGIYSMTSADGKSTRVVPAGTARQVATHRTVAIG